ncbi:MAG: RIP metalloprotease RseP [Bacteroidia bacterium]|nr:RIP metalloprotease RseP [Bacteroidia bacterium]
MLTLGLFLLALSLLIIIHEVGHFLPAKAFGMRVEKFYLFFDWPRKLFSWKKGGTEYGIGLLPLGGYVKIAGMVDESQLGKRSDIPTPPQPDEFRAKPLYQRAIVIVGGPFLNIFYAITVLTALFYASGIQRIPLFRWKDGIEAVPLLGIQAGDRLLAVNGEPAYLDKVASPEWLIKENPYLEIERGGRMIQLQVDATQRDSLLKLYGKEKEVFLPRLPAVVEPIPGGPAARAGIQKGDRITAVNEVPIQSFSDLRAALQRVKTDSVTLQVYRKGRAFSLTVGLDSAGRIHVVPGVDLPQESYTLSIEGAFLESFRQSYRLTVGNLKALYYLITGQMRISDSLSGPIGIARVAGRSYASGGWKSFLAFTAALSLILAIMNLLPIPLLDGGHLLFLGIEAVFRREPSYRLREIAQYVGLAFILALMMFAFWNDLRKL